MALSRAAAAAARKAAKNRGLQGNRAEDGSMLSSPATQKSMKEFYTSSDIDKKSYSEMNDAELGDKWKEVSAEVEELEGLAQEMSDTQLKKAHTQAADEVAELTALGTQMQEKNWLGVDMEKYQKEMSTAKQKLKAFEEELDLRESFEGEFTKRKRKFT